MTATVSIPTTRRIKCPLLIEANHLESLDRILDQHFAQMQSDLQKRIADEATQIVNQLVRKKLVKKDEVEAEEAARRKELSGERRYRQGRSATIYLTKGREINAKSFGEAMTMPIDEDELPVGLSAFIRAGDITAVIQTDHNFDPELRVEVEPNDEEAALSLFGALSNWLSAIEAPRWQQKWQKFKWAAGAFLILVLLIGVGAPLVAWGVGRKTDARDEARRLLAEGGVNANNEHKAIELLLVLAMDPYPMPRPPQSSFGLEYWLYTSLATLILIAAMIHPRICIGLWKGKRRLQAWRVWMRTLTFGIPSLVGLYILIPWILHWLKLTPPSS